MALNCNVIFRHSPVSNDSSRLIRPSLARSALTISHYKVKNNNRNEHRSKSMSVIKCWKGQITPPAHVLEKLLEGLTLVPSIPIPETKTVTRKDFPADFKFGCSTSAFQTEGRGDEGGRGPSTWDMYIQDESTVNDGTATDSYHKYKEDVQMLKAMGVDVYRMSISWSRILPDGTISGGINQEGINFYNNFFQELIDNGITPFVTLFHFDLPSALKQKYGGFTDRQIVDDFKAYADLCFKTFGSKVKYWGTINEPQVWGLHGDADPSDPASQITSMHNIVLSHAAAAKVYKDNYQATYKGEIGISLSVQWFEPLSQARRDVEASLRAFDFNVGWLLEPFVFGDYPFSMRALMGDALPTFSDEEKEMLRGSYDYIGVNYYTSRYAAFVPIGSIPDPLINAIDYQHAEVTVNKDGKPIGDATPGSKEIYVYPKGLTEVLVHMSKHYNNPKIYVTENGYPEKRDDTIPVQIALQDNIRIQYMISHLSAISEAIKSGADVKAYIMWSLIDCVEMGSGYNVRFGLNYVDYLQGMKRIPKKSAYWLNTFLENK